MRFASLALSALLLLLMVNLQDGKMLRASEDKTSATEQSTAAGDKKPDKALYLLKYNFKPKQRVAYDIVQQTKITTQREDIVETVTNQSNARKHYRVVTIVKGTHGILEPVIDHVKMSAQLGNNDSIRYDSKLDKTPPKQFASIHKTIGKPQVRFELAANGELLDTIRLSAVSKTEKQNSTKNDPGQNFLVVFPNQPIEIGHKWSDKIQVRVNVSKTLQRRMTLIRKYKLESVKLNIAIVSLRTAVLERIEDPMVLAQLLQAQPKGTIEFDLEQGLIVKQTVKTEGMVIGIHGKNSSMRIVGHRVERLVSPQKIAQKQP